MAAALRDARWWPVAVALALVPFNWALAGVSWLLIGRRIDPGLRYGEAMSVVLAGHAVAIWTPARVAEFAGRAYLHGRGKATAWMAGTGLETFLRYAPPMLIGGIALGFVDAQPAFPWQVARLVGAAGLVLIVGIAMFPERLRRFLSRRRERPALAFLSTTSRGDILAVLGLNAARLLTGSVQMTLFAIAFRAGASPLVLFAACASALSVKTAIPPVTVGDLGIREAASVVLLGAVGVSAPVALNAALFVYLANVVVGAAVGALVWATWGNRLDGRSPVEKAP
jgi:uncharacterized membrane protein YbhN (UPF0104 family)